MMATTIKQTEALPASYPAAPAGLTVDPAMVWQRIESYIAWRFTSRAVLWVATGPGEWVPPLQPATVTASELWDGAAWQATTPDPSALGGYLLPCESIYRFTATVGGGTVPAAVSEAFRRLAAYMAAKPGAPGARSERIRAGTVEVEKSRSEAWIALALQNSGAADLLRQYRKV